MKIFLFLGIIALLVIVCAAVGRAQSQECPKEQETNWEIELLLRHEDCDKFYKCTFGKPVAMSCPPDLWFNLEEWRCDWPRNVDCEDRNIPAQSTTTSSTTTSITASSTTPTPPTCTTFVPRPPSLPNGCPIDPSIHWLLPHPTDCSAFYHCVWGRLVLRHCPANLHFNAKIQICDWPSNASCQV
ncbi:unnamed protein product [Spodoptera littoralis]|uniref:Chitin-binding type-2 domain-containing protein n=1 Tax=Spodoptera littoralis TaxID=7109 RepID=A0A9P0I1C7_SPOLI|nr:unnamed protein product [Spodoptera littoralis]CAH1637245.1 unnamed protein product [Spodoptera littoralis]